MGGEKGQPVFGRGRGSRAKNELKLWPRVGRGLVSP